MGIRETLSRLLHHKSQEEALPSASIDDLEALPERSEAIKSTEITKEISTLETPPESPKLSPSLELQKESLQLGVAAGYTGKSLKEIESSLNRIESQLVTKDWFVNQFEDRTPEIIRLLQEHDKNQEKRFEMIQNSLDVLGNLAKISPEPLKTRLSHEIRNIESELPLTPRMQEILKIIKENKEMSYENLAKLLHHEGVSGLRGILSNMIKRTNEIERFEKDGKGWIRYIGN